MNTDLPDRLKRATRELHGRAERTGVMAEFLAGRIGLAGYVALLRNLHALYAALEPALSAWPALADPALHRSPALAADLTQLQGPDWAVALPLQPAARAYVQRLQGLAAAGSPALAAHAYVRYLGDLHGGQVLRKLVARTLGPQAGTAIRFYDFGSDDQVLALRRRVRDALAQLPLDEAATDDVLAEARWSFEQHCRLFEQLRGPV